MECANLETKVESDGHYLSVTWCDSDVSRVSSLYSPNAHSLHSSFGSTHNMSFGRGGEDRNCISKNKSRLVKGVAPLPSFQSVSNGIKLLCH